MDQFSNMIGLSVKYHFFPDRYNHQLPPEQFSVSVKKVLAPYQCFEKKLLPRMPAFIKKVVAPYACLHKKSCCPMCYISRPVPVPQINNVQSTDQNSALRNLSLISSKSYPSP